MQKNSKIDADVKHWNINYDTKLMRISNEIQVGLCTSQFLAAFVVRCLVIILWSPSEKR